jgi:hypothetical protein
MLLTLYLQIFTTTEQLICTYFSFNELHFHYNEQFTFARFLWGKGGGGEEIHMQHVGLRGLTSNKC